MQWDLLDDSVQITSQKKRNPGLSVFYMFEDELCHCHEMERLFQVMGISCNPSAWKLIIDSSSRSLKAVFRHNTNNCLFNPLAHSVHMKKYIRLEQ